MGNSAMLVVNASAILKKRGILLLSNTGMDIKMAPTLKNTKKNN
jgi:hypothetical protein